ncbi:MAG: hypothetical protein HY265_08680, partial [Deltaproteobacteria bacterium]|nr:hypothetical protein [Deltaproteobacteria bacterium]
MLKASNTQSMEQKGGKGSLAGKYAAVWPLPYRNEEIEKETRETGANDSIGLYFKSIRKYPLITSKQEKNLAAKIAMGNK